MEYFKNFSDEQIIDMIKNFIEAYKTTMNESFMENVDDLLSELDRRESNI
ncbi:MAG: hypothetical protein ACRCTZ_21665 [Sarcina sp.]